MFMAQKCHFYLGRLLKSVQSATKELAKSTCPLKDQTLVSISPSATLHKPQYFFSGKTVFFGHQQGQNSAWPHLPSLTPPSPLFLLGYVRAATFQLSKPRGAFPCGAHPSQDFSQGNHSHPAATPVLFLCIRCQCSNKTLMYTYINIDR